jgi:hypothetical protein
LSALNPPVVGPCAKRVYGSKTTAKKLARRVNQSGREKVQPYHCTRCHGWHLGTSDYLAQSRGVRRMRQDITTREEEVV